ARWDGSRRPPRRAGSAASRPRPPPAGRSHVRRLRRCSSGQGSDAIVVSPTTRLAGWLRYHRRPDGDAPLNGGPASLGGYDERVVWLLMAIVVLAVGLTVVLGLRRRRPGTGGLVASGGCGGPGIRCRRTGSSCWATTQTTVSTPVPTASILVSTSWASLSARWGMTGPRSQAFDVPATKQVAGSPVRYLRV